MAGPSKRLKRFVFVIAAVFGAAVLVAGIAFAIREARQAAWRQQYSNNMKQVCTRLARI